MLLDYLPRHERSAYGYKWIGHAQFALLSAIPSELRSPHVEARFVELTRRFGEPAGEPQAISAQWIGSPIEENATDRMTDDQWLGAIAKYRSELPTFSARDEYKGGASQLAQVLATRVQQEPDRFARLSLRFPSDTNPVYLGQTLAALKDASVDSDLKLQVCRKAFDESRGDYGRAIADVLGSVEDPLPSDAVAMLHWLATGHDDPVAELWQEDAGGGRKHLNGEIETVGINTTRGRAAIAVRDLILHDAAYVEQFHTTLDRMIRDPSTPVLSCVAGTLRAVAFRNPALGMSFFRDMNVPDVRLLATRDVCEFIRYRLRDSFVELRPVLERMLRSSEPKVCAAGARLSSLALLMDQSAADLVDQALDGDCHHRLGVAQIASGHIAISECRRWSEEMLAELFNDDDRAVRGKAASCFRQLKDEVLETYGELIEAFCDSKAFQEDSFSVLRMLEKSLGRLPGMTCLVCERFLDRFADEARDVRTHRAADMFTVAKLVFRTYQQHQNDEWTSRSLNLIDYLCLEVIDDARSHLDQFER